MDTKSTATGATAATTTSAGGRKKIDDRVKVLLDDCARKKHRSVFLLLGDRSKDQITQLHAMVSRTMHTAKVSVLWCMKSEPLFVSTAKGKLRRQGEREVKAGMASEETKDAFEAFLAHNDIRFTHYKDTHRVLGQTFGMAVLQDFEAMTPNILARTIETVAGGGAILILLRSMHSLRQLHTLSMDVHARYRSETHGAVVPRFNERFLLSLCDCENMLALDDDLNVLPITNNVRNMLARKQQAAASQAERLRLEGCTKHEAELSDLKGRLKGHATVGPLVSAANTVDQAKTVLGLMQAIAEKTLNATCAVTAGRGRGKSAALGLALAGAIREGYSNILVTAPSPDNLGTLFDFAVRGLKELGYAETADFTVMRSANPDFAKCIVAIHIFREHRQTIQFVAATDSEHFRHAEIVVVDEAAAIPLPLVQRMLGPYLVFLSSTISGYEGTGRSLSLKLIADMKKRNAAIAAASAAGEVGGDAPVNPAAAGAHRVLRELPLQDPIRYGPDDPVEAWLNKLLCFDAVSETVVAPKTVPHPNTCELYYVDRDALFSYHPTAEALLHRIMALLVAAHYKNQPNDLQLLSDAPGHHIFVLCAPASSILQQQQQQQAAASGGDVAAAVLPDILCVVHAAEEGDVTADNLAANLDRGSRPSGDLIPYTIAQHYLEKSFAQLKGMRIVRIATNPEIQRSGYGSRALELFIKYFEGKLQSNNAAASAAATISAISVSSSSSSSKMKQAGRTSSKNDHDDDDDESNSVSAPRKQVPTLLRSAASRPLTEAAEYLGVSFGLNVELYNFWNRARFDAIYLRQVPNELTAEHSCIMTRSLVDGGLHVFDTLQAEFRRRFLSLLAMSFRSLPVELGVCLVSGASGRQNFSETVAKRKRIVIAGAKKNDDHDDDDDNNDADVACRSSNNNNNNNEGQRRSIFVGNARQLSWQDLSEQAGITESDLRRLKLYASGTVDVAVVLDLAPSLASLYFRDMLHFRPASGADGVVLSAAQRAVLLSVALQGRFFDELSEDLKSSFFGMPATQLKGVFHKAMGKFAEHLEALQAEQRDDGKGSDEGVDEEEVKRDAKGNIVGLQVVRRVARKIETDRTLLHDAGSATVGGAVADNNSTQRAHTNSNKRGGGGGGAGGKRRNRSN